MSYLRDKNGKLSSKRIAGYTGLLIGFILTVLAVFFNKSGSAKDMLSTWLIFSGTCLGVGVFEKAEGGGK